ncbi:MAG: glycoside hydrolase family 38 C-terminal domain-containing protein [Bacillota bacterium]|nr:glycoside hydrolase family 38 C-terminal domain-containing protein [Bacillota bacterium]
MELNIEWQGRIEKWIETLASDLYFPLGDIPLEGRVVNERLSLEEALAGKFAPVKTGDRLAKSWEYLWLRGSFALPSEAAGKRIVMQLETGGESSIYVNGEEFGTRRGSQVGKVKEPYHMICDQTLTRDGRAGDRFEIALEVYAGHPMPVRGNGRSTGPIIPGSISEKDGDAARLEIGQSTFGIWNETAYQLLMDVKVLWDILNHIPRESLRSADIWEGLKNFTTIVDFEQEPEDRNKCYEAARSRLKPLLECVNGSTMPEFYAFGHAHIDIAWLWPIAETERKVMRTFAAQLRHMDEYPEYKFLQSQPHLYRMVKQMYPNLYEKIKEKVKNGQWIPEGGMWVEADTNVSGGEALIRQFVHGKRFFKDEFGVDSRMLWLPDVFGYTAALPQIMKGCGIDSFSTQKLLWSYNGGDEFPYNYFDWVGIDGTGVKTFMHANYNSQTYAGDMIDRWNSRRQRSGIRGFLVPFGYGDGGGGPSRDHMESVMREHDIEGCPKLKCANPNEFFKNHPAPIESYVGELYLQCHRGTLTSQAKTKKGNRKCELALRESEFWAAASKLKFGYDYPYKTLDELWKDVLLCQFHDILPGSSIARVYTEAEALYDRVLDSLSNIRKNIAKKCISYGNAVTVLNSLSWERTAYVPLPDGFEGASANGTTLPVQKIGGKLIAKAAVPPCGSVTLIPAKALTIAEGACAYIDENAVLENSFIKAVFNKKGEITSIMDKSTGRELARGLCNEMKMYKDIPRKYEAWDIDLTYEACPVALNGDAVFEISAEGPLMAALKITRTLNNSIMTQFARLTCDSARVDFETMIDWNESHKLLKVGFDVDYNTDEAMHEIQFGYVKRPNHRSRQYDLDRFEVSNHKWTALAESNRGFAVLNDCKYGVNVVDSCINLTLLRSTGYPDANADIGRQSFTYSFYPYNGNFKKSGVVKEGYFLNCPVEVMPGAGFDGSLMTVSEENIVIETFKAAEDGSEDYIMRMYESAGTRTDAKLEIKLPCGKAYSCDMLENIEKEIPVSKRDEIVQIPLSFKPFEIKTIKLSK